MRPINPGEVTIQVWARSRPVERAFLRQKGAGLRQEPSWVAQGHNLALVQKAAGHASMRTSMLYVHLVDDDLSQLVAAPATRRRRSMGMR